MVSFSYLPKHSGKSIFLELKSNKKAAPHGEAFTININLKILFMNKLFTSFFQPNDDDCTNEQPC